QLGARYGAGEPGEVPAPVDDAARRGRDARGHGPAERFPRGILVARPVQAVRLRAGEPGAGERHGCLAVLAQQVTERARVVDGVQVVPLVAAAPVAVPEVVAPGMLAAIGLEAVDVELADEVLPP